MRDARRNLNFRGTAAFLRDSELQMVTVVHAVVGGVEHESMRSLDDPDREVVRQPGRAVYSLPQAQRSLAEAHGPNTDGMGSSSEHLENCMRFYRFSLGAQERLIGRLSQEVLIEPLDAYRYARRFWIDADSKLPLKYQVLSNGRVLEQLVFSDLTLEGKGSEFRSAETDDPALQYLQEQLPLEALQWRLERVPPGYKLISYTRHTAPGKKPIEHLLLGDGLSALSLYIEKNDDAFRLEKQRHHLGAIHVYARPIGDYQITVMGEAPAAAVELVGDGVRRLRQQ